MQASAQPTAAPARREALRRILRDGQVRRQAELVRLLRAAGHEVTQSSVSRALRELGVAKLGDRYVLAEEAAPPSGADFRAVVGSVRALHMAGPCLRVLRATVGAAQGVAVAIDRARWREVAGTLSGDDTI